MSRARSLFQAVKSYIGEANANKTSPDSICPAPGKTEENDLKSEANANRQVTGNVL